MTLVLRCQSCRSSQLEIRSATPPHHAGLYCQNCDRWLRWLSRYQAKTFSRHLPQQAAEPQRQLSLLEGGES